MWYAYPCTKVRLRSVGGVFVFRADCSFRINSLRPFSPASRPQQLSSLECAVPSTPKFCTILVQISPLDSALTDTPHVTPLECAVPGNGGEGVVSRLCVAPCVRARLHSCHNRHNSMQPS